jgi:hypothetical protein
MKVISLWMRNNCRCVLVKFMFSRVSSDVEDFQLSVASADEEERERLRDEEGISSAAGRLRPDWPAVGSLAFSRKGKRDLSLLRPNRPNPGVRRTAGGRLEVEEMQAIFLIARST